MISIMGIKELFMLNATEQPLSLREVFSVASKARLVYMQAASRVP